MKITGEWIGQGGVQTVLGILLDAGHEAYLVGGCVRNALIAHPVADIDIATNALPERVLALASSAGLRAIPTGIEHGTVTVLADDRPHEVTTFRRDIETDGRHARVVFSDRIEDDAARRDLTMNALYANRLGLVIDPLGGLQDLLDRRVRFVGDPVARISEDYLRILRFFRFHAWYGDPASGFDPDGLAACAALSAGIETLSRERVGQEMRKLLDAPDPAPSVATMQSAGVLALVLPGADARALAPLVHFEAGLAPDWIRRAATLGGPDPTDALRLSRAESKRLLLLREGLASAASPAELAYRHGVEPARDIVLLRAAVLESPMPADWPAEIAKGAAATFPVSAADLMPDLSGERLGTRLKELERRWIGSGFTLSREQLLA